MDPPDSRNIKTLLASNKFTLKKNPSFLLIKNIPVTLRGSRE